MGLKFGGLYTVTNDHDKKLGRLFELKVGRFRCGDDGGLFLA